MGLFKRKIKITPTEFTSLLHYSIQNAALGFMDKKEQLQKIGLENTDVNQIFLENLVFNSFCFIEIFYRSPYDNTIKNAILDGMHNILYKSFCDNCNYSIEEINDFKQHVSYRYDEYQECMESENWIRELSKIALTNMLGENPNGELEIYHMSIYTSLLYRNLPELYDKYKLILR